MIKLLLLIGPWFHTVTMREQFRTGPNVLYIHLGGCLRQCILGLNLLIVKY